ncbi:MAG: TonB-dependent receptor [Bacteroidales bacterium]|nr:TonB-dependent receptor [Bacteroidales bacterium]
MEFLFNYQPVEGLRLHTNYTFIHMKNPLPATPGHNLFLSSTYNYKKWHFRLKLQCIFDLYNETGQGVKVIEKDYQLLGARIGYQATRFLNFYLAVNNLLDEEYQINYGYPMPGINFMGGISLKLTTYK